MEASSGKICSQARTYFLLVELLVCMLGLVPFNEYHDLAYKIFRIGSCSYKTLFSCLVATKKAPRAQVEERRITLLHRLWEDW